MKRFLFTIPLLLPLGCDEVGHAVANRGEVCIDREQVLDFRQTDDLEIQVLMDCEAACVRDEEASCEATIDGPYIRLESHFAWSDAPDDDCATKCEQMTATCKVPQTFPGSYTLVHGLDQFVLDLPSNPLIECLSPMDPEDQADASG